MVECISSSSKYDAADSKLINWKRAAIRFAIQGAAPLEKYNFHLGWKHTISSWKSFSKVPEIAEASSETNKALEYIVCGNDFGQNQSQDLHQWPFKIPLLFFGWGHINTIAITKELQDNLWPSSFFTNFKLCFHILCACNCNFH